MLIDSSYFCKGSRHILNASLGTENTLPNHNAMEVNRAIQGYIEEYQERFLSLMLGQTLGNRVNAYLVCLDEDENPKHMPNLDAVCDRLREPFADFVFFHILRDMNTQSTMTGLVRLKCANEYVAPIRRQVRVWNSMAEKNRQFGTWSESSDCPMSGISVDADMLTYINPLNL